MLRSSQKQQMRVLVKVTVEPNKTDVEPACFPEELSRSGILSDSLTHAEQEAFAEKKEKAQHC